jgi:PAS domain S-box-containing protein
MVDKEHPSEDRYAKLRGQAEDLISQHSRDGKQPSPEEIQSLVHELEVYQIELEMQNEELVHAQVELETVLDRYTNLYDFAPVGYLTLTEKGIILDANLTAASMLGVERKKLVKQLLSNFVFREDQNAYYLYKKNLFAPHNHLVEVMRLYRQDGVPLFALLDGLTIPGEDGEWICYLTISDISSQKAAEKRLVEKEERFRIMADFTQDWEYLIGPDMKFVYISPSCEGITGYKAEEFRNDPQLLMKIVHPDDREEWQKHESIILQTNPPGSLDLCIVTRSGEARWIHHLCQSVYDTDGEWMGRQVSNRDITERKMAEKEREKFIEELRRAKELQQTLSQRLMDAQENERRLIAHDLHDEVGQALTAIKINLQTIQRKQNNDLGLDESIVKVERALEQVRAISLNLPPPMLEDVGLAAALRWLLEQQSRAADFGASFSANLGKVRLPQHIEIACYRVAQEALTNIMRYSQARQVKMELAQVDQELQLTIEDDGIGFDVEMAYENARSGKSLGLVSMYERAHLAGGHFVIESRIGQGTMVQASFPIFWHDQEKRLRA